MIHTDREEIIPCNVKEGEKGYFFVYSRENILKNKVVPFDIQILKDKYLLK